MARGDRGGLDGTCRQAADAAQIGRREPSADLGQGLAVAVAQEDRGPVRLEQDHRMIGESAKDPVELEPAADVARDAAQRLRPMQVLGDFRGSAAHPDDPADRLGREGRKLDVSIRKGLAGDEQHAPRPGRPGDGDGHFGRRLGVNRCKRGNCRQVGIGAPREPRQRVTGRALGAPPGEGTTQDAAVGRHGHEAARKRARRGARHELVVDQLPRGNELGGGRFAEHVHNLVQGTIDIAGRSGQAHQLGDDRQVEAAVTEVRIVWHGQIGQARRGWSAPTAVAIPPGDSAGKITDRTAGRGRQEALEVAEAVTPVAARIDPVVAQPAGVAPRPNRVRVHAEQPCRLGDGQRGVDGSIWEGGRHPGRRALVGGNVNLRRRAYRPDSSCQ